MIFRRYGTFTGGIDLPDEKRDALASPIRPAPETDRLRVPLAVCGGRAAEPVVRAGQAVRAGERIAAAPDASAVDVFAPASGRVAAFATAWVAGPSGFVESPAIELAELGEPPGLDRPRRAFDWSAAEEDALRQRIGAGQLTTFRGRPVPLARWLLAARENACHTLLANVIEHEPCVAADHRLLVEHAPEVVEGLAVLRKALGVKEAVLAADRRRTRALGRLAAAADRFDITRVALPHKYPIGADAILAKVLTRRESPPGAGPLSVGVAVVGAAACLAVYRWVVCGRRATGRVVTAAAPGAGPLANLWVPFGMPCERLLEAGGRLLVHGGPMTGLPVRAGAVVSPATDAVLALERRRAPLPGPCIRCGWCTDHCPARLNVTALNDDFELSLLDRARRRGVMACVECGVCSYVCPARLPLAQRVKQLKRRIAASRPAPAAGVQ